MNTNIEQTLAALRTINTSIALKEATAWKARPYQVPAIEAWRSGVKRLCLVWHRRAGKDTTALNITVEAALDRVGLYWHMLPTTVQGRKVVWDGIGKDGKKFLDAWPKNSIVKSRQDEMKLEFDNGSMWQVVGSDNYDALVGSNPVGVVFSEYSVADPRSWDFIRPILAENGGWAIFPYTPRGHNHGLSLLKNAREADDWFTQILTINDTGSITKEAVDAERKAGMSEEMIQQEFYCSFDAPLHGSYYGPQMADALNEGRITKVPHQRGLSVDTWWDLGHSDATAIWFVQYPPGRTNIIGYYEATGADLDHYAAYLANKEREGWVYGTHFWPHDGGAKTLASRGKPLSTMMRDLGYSVQVQPRHDLYAGINRVRQVLPSCWMDETHCEQGIECLRAYQKKEDESRGTDAIRFFQEKPLHNWASHGSDAFRTGAMAGQRGPKPRTPLIYPEKHISNQLKWKRRR